MARPTKYKAEFSELAYNYCLLGADDSDLARFFEVAESTINKWKLDHSQFSESIKKGKDQADAEVAARLHKRALGYEHEEVELKVIGKDIIHVPLVKHYPPDTTAAIFWLKNRQKGKWRDKTETELSGETINKVEVAFIKPE